MANEHYLQSGTTSGLYTEYIKRSKPFTMTEDHYHTYYEIYCLLSGERTYFIHDRSYQVESGDLVWIAKHDVHKTLQHGAAAHERLIIHVTDEWLFSVAGLETGLLLEPFGRSIRVLRLPQSERRVADAAIQDILREMQSAAPGCELMIAQSVIRLMLTAARYMRLHNPAPLRHASPLHAKIADIAQHINGSYSEPLRLEELAEQFYISKHYLSRMFRKVTGFSFSDYVALTRIKEAQRLLAESESTVSEIAGLVGFDNFSHFGKTFKRLTRTTPRQYRKNNSP